MIWKVDPEFQIHLSSRINNQKKKMGERAIFKEGKCLLIKIKKMKKKNLNPWVVRIWKTEKNYKPQKRGQIAVNFQKVKGREIPKSCQKEKAGPLQRGENRVPSAISLGNQRAYLHSRWHFFFLEEHRCLPENVRANLTFHFSITWRQNGNS